VRAEATADDGFEEGGSESRRTPLPTSE